MFCPNCSAENETSQKFCRQCGLNIEGAAESLTAQKAVRTKNKNEGFSPLGRGIAIGSTALFFMMLASWTIFVIFKYLIIPGPSGKVMLGLWLLFMILFTVVMAGRHAFRSLNRNNKTIAAMLEETNLFFGRTTGKRLASGELLPVASVTVNSADLSYDARRTRKLDE